MVHGIHMVEVSQAVRVGRIESLDPAFNDGAPGPATESRWGFEVDAVQFKIRLDIGFGWVEWRSWTRLDHT
jgi:hypothetical protein